MRLGAFASCVVLAALTALPVRADDGVRLGETYRNLLQLKTYGSPQVPLPPGDWKLVTLSESRDRTANVRMVQGSLIQVRSGVLTGRVIFEMPDSPSRGGWTRPSICDRKSILANYTRPEASPGSYDCLTIEPVSMIRAPNVSQLGAQFYDYLDANKIKKPNAAISAAFNVSDGRTFFNVAYLFNPDIEKIAPVGAASWHLDRYKDDPKRATYVENVKAWAQALRPKVLDGSKGRLPDSFVAEALPSLPTVAALAAQAKAAASTVARPRIGDVYRETFQLNTYGAPQIPLPPGDWKLVVFDRIQNQQQKIPLVRGYLIQTQGDVLAGHVFFAAPDDASASPWNPPGSCSQKTPLADFTANKGSSKGFDCAAIVPYSATRPQKATDQLAKYHDYLEANGIKSPATMLNVAYGISDAATYVMAEYRFNAAIDGVRADSVAAWRAERLGEDSKRAAYVEKMKAWAQEWQAKIQAGYKSALPKAAALN